jgi:hypothetical protein
MEQKRPSKDPKRPIFFSLFWSKKDLVRIQRDLVRIQRDLVRIQRDLGPLCSICGGSIPYILAGILNSANVSILTLFFYFL